LILLREKRTEKGLSQQELARISGVSQQAISAIESGDRENTRVDKLYLLAKALGCAMDDLYVPDGEEEQDPDGAETEPGTALQWVGTGTGAIGTGAGTWETSEAGRERAGAGTEQDAG
jgi:putative transcriptional regulator